MKRRKKTNGKGVRREGREKGKRNGMKGIEWIGKERGKKGGKEEKKYVLVESDNGNWTPRDSREDRSVHIPETKVRKRQKGNGKIERERGMGRNRKEVMNVRETEAKYNQIRGNPRSVKNKPER